MFRPGKVPKIETVIEAHLQGLAGETNKLVMVLSNSIVMVYSPDTQTTKTLADACTRHGRADRADLLYDVQLEIGYVEEQLKTLKRIEQMLRPASEVRDGR